RPVAGAAAYVANEVREQLPAVWRVHDFGVEHSREEATILVNRDRVGGTLRLGDDPETVGQCLDPVAVAHPHLVLFADLPQAVEQRALVDDLDKRPPELAVVALRDHAAELVRHGLLAVADPEHRQPCVEEMLRRAWTVFPHHRAWPA